MGKVAFLFAGQGAQKMGMGLPFLAISSRARAVFELASDALGYDMEALVREGPAERLAETELTQPAILAASLAAAAALDEEGVEPDMGAGLSLGEYGALVHAGALPAEEAFPLVRDRGRYMQEAVPLGEGGMVAVLGMDAEAVEACCRKVREGVAEPANYNCPGQIVVAGDAKGLVAFKALAKDAGARRLVDLPVSAPFHCSLLEPAGRRLAERLEGIELREPRYPVIANMTAEPLPDVDAIKPNLALQVHHPVRFEASIRRMLASGVDVFVEIGPGTSLGGFVRKVSKDAEVYNTDTLQGFEDAVELRGRRASRGGKA